MIPTRMNPMGLSPYSRRLGYLEASGTQYIDTGITPGADFTAEITLSVLSGTNMSCGGRQGYAINDFRITTNVNQIDFAFGGNPGSYYGQDFKQFRTVLFGTDGKLYIDNTLVAERTGTFTEYKPFWLFLANNNGSPMGGSGGRIARAVLKSGGVKVRDLIPVLDNSGVPCMYDEVSKQCFYNQGTGQFQYAEVPHTYLNYLESTGTQYIDTGVAPQKDMAVEIGCNIASSMNELHVLFGARDVSGSNYNAFIIWHDTAQGQPRFDYGNEFGASAQSSVTFPITNLRKEGAKNYVNGTLISENTAVSDIICNNTCRLFAASGLTYTAQAKVTRCRIWQDGTTLTRDFIPVLDKSGVPCMYDRCTRSLYYNAGTGTFNYA